MTASIVIGTDTVTGAQVIPPAAARALSTYVIGKPGMGKSTLLENIALQDIENGDGLCFLDPHGDSVEKLLHLVPRHRAGDVIYWNPKDIARPFGLNPFSCADRDDQLLVDQQAENFISALASLEEFSEVFRQAPRMSDILRHLAFAFLLTEGYTLLETPRFLTRSDFRAQFYPAIAARGRYDILEYWQEFDELPTREQRELVASSRNKLRRLTTTTVLRLLFGQATNSIDFRAVMDQGKIMLVNVHNLGEGNAEVIGAFIVWGILSAAYSRGDIPQESRRPFHLIADEFQKFTSTAFPKLVDEGRKYRVDTVVAHQGRDQLEGQTRGATLRAPNRIVFQVMGADARELAWEFDTTPPPPEVVSRRAELVLSPEPWTKLLKSGHAHPKVMAVMKRVERFFLIRNTRYKNWETSDAEARRLRVTQGGRLSHNDYFGYQGSGVCFSVDWAAPDGTRGTATTTEHGRTLTFRHALTMETLGEWANPYLLARQEGRDEGNILSLMTRLAADLTDRAFEYPTNWQRWQPPIAHSKSQAEARIYVRFPEAIGNALADLMRTLGDLLAQPENHIKTESGQFEAVLGSQLSSDEVANRIANELVHLNPYTARCRIGGREHTIITNDVPQAAAGEQTACDIQGASQVTYGRDRAAVEQEITMRLRAGPETGHNAMMEADGRHHYRIPAPDTPRDILYDEEEPN